MLSPQKSISCLIFDLSRLLSIFFSKNASPNQFQIFALERTSYDRYARENQSLEAMINVIKKG